MKIYATSYKPPNIYLFKIAIKALEKGVKFVHCRQ